MKLSRALLVLAMVHVFWGCTSSNSGGGASYQAPDSTYGVPGSYGDDDSSVQVKQSTPPEHFEWHSSNPWWSDQDQPDSTLTAESEDYFSNQDVECDGECQEGVGLLMASTLSGQVDVCTVFLVDSDVAMTDSHCIPDDLKAGGSAYGRLQVKFPASNESIDVNNVIFASDLSNKNAFNQDYALLQLSQASESSPLSLSRSGFPDKSGVTIWKVTRIPNLAGGPTEMLSEITCTAMQNTGLFPEFKGDQSPMVALANCDVVPGNSGSPIFNEKGQVIGLVKAIFNIQETPVGETMNSDDVARLPRFILASNLSCIKDFTPGVELPSACNEDLSNKAYLEEFNKRMTAALALANTNIDDEVQEKIRQWQSQNSQVFRWKFVKSDLHTNNKVFNDHPSFQPEIDCIQPMAQWINSYKELKYFYKSKAQVTGGLYSFGPGAAADSNFNLYPDARAWNLGTYEITFDPSEIQRRGTGQVTLTEKMNIFGKTLALPLTYTVPVCQ